MAKLDWTEPRVFLGIFSVVVSAIMIVLSILNYMQDGKWSSVVMLPIFGILLGIYLIANGNKSRAADE